MYNTFTHCIPSYATFYNGKDPSASTSYDYHIGFKLPSQVHSLLIVYCLTPTDNSLKNISCNYLLPINGLITVGTILYCFFLKINDYFYLINWLFLLFYYFYFILISLYYLIKHRSHLFFLSLIISALQSLCFEHLPVPARILILHIQNLHFLR